MRDYNKPYQSYKWMKFEIKWDETIQYPVKSL